MRFEARTFCLPKDADETAQYQDAFTLDAETGRAAIADGVSSAIFSGPWARLLTLAAVAGPPPLDDAEAFQAWLTENRAAWAASVDTSKLTWYQRPKMVDGAMTTLLWVELSPVETNAEGFATRYRLRSFAIGDSCLFHLREGKLLYWFPLESAGDFGLNPAVVGSVDRQLDHLLEFKAREQECLPGDLVVLATDAVALWAVERQESGEAVDWSRYWDYSHEDWCGEIDSLRDAKQMRFDDSTLVLLRVIEERPAPAVEPPDLIGPEPAVAAEETTPAEAASAAARLTAGPSARAAEEIPPAEAASPVEETEPKKDLMDNRSALLARIGDINNPALQHPLVSLELFFEGNNDYGSIGCNLPDSVEPGEFYDLLKRLRDRDDVQDILIEVTQMEDPDGWPFSDTIWFITRAAPESVQLWFPARLAPDSIVNGFEKSAERVEPYTVPNGFRAIAAWYD